MHILWKVKYFSSQVVSDLPGLSKNLIKVLKLCSFWFNEFNVCKNRATKNIQGN